MKLIDALRPARKDKLFELSLRQVLLEGREEFVAAKYLQKEPTDVIRKFVTEKDFEDEAAESAAALGHDSNYGKHVGAIFNLGVDGDRTLRYNPWHQTAKEAKAAGYYIVPNNNWRKEKGKFSWGPSILFLSYGRIINRKHLESFYKMTPEQQRNEVMRMVLEGKLEWPWWDATAPSWGMDTLRDAQNLRYFKKYVDPLFTLVIKDPENAIGETRDWTERVAEDLDALLANYVEFLPALKRINPKFADLRNFDNLVHLIDTIENLQLGPIEGATPSGIQRLAQAGIKVIGKVQDFDIFQIPKSAKGNEEAWQAYRQILCGGGKTRLCTAATQSNFNKYLRYTDFFLLWNTDDTNAPYQISAPNGFYNDDAQFMNRQDKPVDIDKFKKVIGFLEDNDYVMVDESPTSQHPDAVTARRWEEEEED